ncbi:MAG: hypothetical protein VX642_06655 [Bdellovibrionota bacterium]|nr:hypothetical protein [Bdellovibrionota bacterium]
MKLIILMGLGLVSTLVVFQNCSGTGFDSVAVDSMDLSSYHADNGYDCEGTQCHDLVEKVETNKYLSQIGNVDYVRSVLEQMFLVDGNDKTNEKIEKIIKDKLLMKRVFFGGRCTHYDDNELCYAGTSHQGSKFEIRESGGFAGLEHGGIVSASREGVRMQVCDKLIADEEILMNMLENADLDINSEINIENLSRLFNLYYPELDPSEGAQNLFSAYKDFFIDSKLERWQKLSLIVCYSSGWQYY